MWSERTFSYKLNTPQAGGSAFNQIVSLTANSSLVHSPEIIGSAIALLFWPCLIEAAAFNIQLTAVTAGFGHF